MLDTQLHTRDKIVELGRTYIQQVGYHSFNYKQIALALNIKNAAIHHYYPSKEDLAVAVIQKDHSDFKRMKEALTSQSPLQNLEALLNNYNSYCSDGKLCVIGTFETAVHEISEKIKSAATSYLDDVFNWLKGSMQAGLDNGDFHFKQSAAELAEVWLATLPGALMTSRLRGENAFKTLQQQLRNSLIHV